MKGNERSVSYLKFSFYTLEKAVKGLFLKKFVFKQHSLMNNWDRFELSLVIKQLEWLFAQYIQLFNTDYTLCYFTQTYLIYLKS